MVILGVIAALWSAYWLLTRRRLPVRRRWRWRRLYIRTLDKLIDDPRAFAFVVGSPIILYWAATALLGFQTRLLGWAAAACASLVIGVLAVRRALKWMNRALRPADQARARWHDRILSGEYRTRRRK